MRDFLCLKESITIENMRQTWEIEMENPAKPWEWLKKSLALGRNLDGREMQAQEMQIHKRGLRGASEAWQNRAKKKIILREGTICEVN